MKKDYVSLAREYVKSECEKSTSKYGAEPFENHFAFVYKYAMELNERLGADKEIVGISAWMHDIGSIIKGRDDHHITGAKIAGWKLEEWGYPHDRILKVQHCILCHRGSDKKNQPETPEARIVSEADAMANFDNVVGIIKAAVMYEGLTQEQARKAVLKKLEGKWEQLSSYSREFVEEKYHAVRVLFGD